ncbi:lysophospholipid acyltransferase family protein [Tsukamurella soli]|uniref:lysophospholipid acyltransferase family protein n=1 Tax=Tsukamurella soli TaxID=644556 RepID=UPI00360DBF04
MSLDSLRSTFRYRVARHALIGPALWVWGRPRVTGRQHIPRTGPVILAANHLAISDSFFVVQSARRPVMFLAKSDYFTQPGLRGRVKKVFFSGMGQIPVDRSGGAKASPRSTRPRRSSAVAAHGASTRKAPAPPTAASTRATRA